MLRENPSEDIGTETVPESKKSRVESIVTEARKHHEALLEKTNEAPAAFDAHGQSLVDANFSGFKFYNGTYGPDFSDTVCRNTNFSGCNLVEANFQNADLRGADFRGANLRDAGIDGALFDETTKGLEQFRDASVNYSNFGDQAERCKATAKGILLVLGRAPTTEDLEGIQQELREFVQPVVTTASYQRSIEQSKRRKKIHSKDDTKVHDSFDHSPADSMDEFFTPPITKTTPLNDLYKTTQGYNLFWGHYDIFEDTPGKSLQESNTRHLLPSAKNIIESYRGRSCTVLDMGAGAGVAAGDLSRIPGVTVDTVALSPTSPTLRLTMSWQEIYKNIARAFHERNQPWEYWERILTLRGIDDMAIAGVRRLFYCTKKDVNMLLKPEFPLKTRVALALDAALPQLGIFQSSDSPYIRDQYIGVFPEGVDLPSETYDVIEDDNGPLWHLSRISSESDQSPSIGIDSLIHILGRSLREDGCIICRRIEPNEKNLKGLETTGQLLTQKPGWEKYQAIQERQFWVKHLFHGNGKKSAEEAEAAAKWPFDDGDLLLLGTEKHPAFAFIKAKSHLATEFRKKLGLDAQKGGFYRVQDLENVIDSLARKAA